MIMCSNDVEWQIISELLYLTPYVDIVHHIADHRDVLIYVSISRPDIVFIPSAIGGIDTGPLVSQIKRVSRPTMRIVIFSASVNIKHICALGETGIHGYLSLNDLSLEDLESFLESVLLTRMIVISPAVMHALLEMAKIPPTSSLSPPYLSERELKVLHGLADGLTRIQIAKTEQMSLRTVKRIVASLEAKLAANNQFVLGHRASQLGLLQ